MRSARVHPRIPAAPRGKEAEHLPALRRAFQAGQKEYGPLGLSFETFARGTLERVEIRLARAGLSATRKAVAELLEKTACRDLFLAIACEERVKDAWEVLVQKLLPRLEPLLRHGGVAAAEASELAQDLPGELIAPAGTEDRMRLGSYLGRSGLLSWLLAVALKALATRRRRIRPISLESFTDKGELATNPLALAPAPDPLAETEAGEAAERFGGAWAASWPLLTPREKLVILLRFRDGLKQVAVARLLRVGEPRVSRLLDNALAKLRRKVASQCDMRAWSELGPLWPSLRESAAKSLARSAAL